jgi:hypothetical protein
MRTKRLRRYLSAGLLHYASLDNGIERELRAHVITTIQQLKLEDIGTVLHNVHGVIVTLQ